MPRGPAVHASAHCAHAEAEAAVGGWVDWEPEASVLCTALLAVADCPLCVRPPGPLAGCAAGLFQGALELAARYMADHSDWMVRDAAVRLAGSLAAATVACIAPTATPSGGEQARADRVLGRLAEGLVCAATGDGEGYVRMAALEALAFATAPAATAGYAECYDCLAALEALPTATAHTPAQLQALRPTSVQADQQPHGHTLDRQQRLSPTLDRSHTLELPHKGAQGAAASQPGHSQSAAAESAREKAANDSAAAVPFPNCVVGCAAAAAAAAAAARLDELLADPTVLGACVRLGLEDSEALVRRAAMDLLTSWGASAQIAGLWAAPAAHACAARRHQLSIWVRRLANDSDWEVRLRILHLVRLLAALPPPPTPPLAGAPGQGRSEDGAAAGRLVHPGWGDLFFEADGPSVLDHTLECSDKPVRLAAARLVLDMVRPPSRPPPPARLHLPTPALTTHSPPSPPRLPSTPLPRQPFVGYPDPPSHAPTLKYDGRLYGVSRVWRSRPATPCVALR